MKLTIYAALIAAITLISSCKKTNDENTTEAMLLGKWVLKTWTSSTKRGSQPPIIHNDNYNPDEYLQFAPEGKFFIRVDNTITASTWKVLDNGKTLYVTPAGNIDIPDDGYEIKTLTGQKLVLYSKEVDAVETYEITINLEKE